MDVQWTSECQEGCRIASARLPGADTEADGVEYGMHEALWIVIIVAGVCALLFVLDLLGIASFIFSSTRKK